MNKTLLTLPVLLAMGSMHLPAQPVVTIQPTNQIVLNGSNVMFSVGATGSGLLTYQWQFNGTNLPNDLITTVAGNGNGGFSGDGVLATASSLHYPLGITVDPAGNLFIADNYNSRIRRVDTHGIISTVAGNGSTGYSGSGVATNVTLTDPSGVAVDSSGNIFFVDSGNQQTYRVDAAGMLTAIAPIGTFYNPLGIAIDNSGHLYIADASNNRVKEASQSGASWTIATVAGDGDASYYGDGGLATAAGVHQPFGVAVDGAGNLFIAEASSGCIRKVDTNGIISTVTTGLNEPYGVAVDTAGDIYIADTWNGCIRKQDTNGMLTTVAGGGTSSADNISAASSSLNNPEGVAVDAAGNIFVADTFNNRVRMIEYPGRSLILNNLATNNAGDYCVIISNSSGSITSSIAHLTVALPPGIATPPPSQQVVAGTNVVFSVAAVGTEPLRYQWQFNGTNLNTATNTTYVIDPALLDSAGNYSAIITNLYGCITSSPAVLTVVPLSLTLQPQSQLLLAGSNVTFNVSAISTQPLAFQWLFNGGVIDGATDSSYSMNPLTTDSSGNYSVVLTNLYGSVTSTVAVLTVVAMDITNQPRSQSILAGSNVTFSVSGSVFTPVTCQWQFNGTNIAGATNASYSIAPVMPANAGNYTVILTNIYGSSTSSVAMLTVLVLPPGITTQPMAQEVPAGGTATFGVTASGTAPLNYQWLWSGSPLDSQTNPVLSLPNVSPGQAGAYRVVITNAYGSITSRVVPLVIGTPPTITAQPTNQSVLTGHRALLSAGISGTGPLTFQWQLNGTNLPNNLISTIAGNGTNGFAGDGGIATTGKISVAYAVAADGAGNVFIADAGTRTPFITNYRIRKVDNNGVMTTVAGNGAPSFSGDGGAATNARIREADGVAVDGLGNLYISDSGNNRIRKVDTNGVITTVAGGGASGDGAAATNASLVFPCGIALDGNGNLFIADNGHQRIRKVDTNGIITTVAGTSSAGFSGDGGLATNATLNSPQSVAVDGVGNLFIADLNNNRIRKVDTNGIMTTLAGDGSSGLSADGGLATNVSISNPYGVAVDGYGDLLIADSGHERIRQVDPYGVIITVAGTNTIGYNPNPYLGDGVAATNTQLSLPSGVAVDSYGRILFTDTFSYRVRRFGQGPTLVLDRVNATNAGDYTLVVNSSFGSVTSAVATLTVWLPPAITRQPASQSVGLGSNATFSVAVSGTQPLSYFWTTNGVGQPAQTNQSLNLTNVQWTDAGSYQVVITNNYGSVTSAVATMTVGVPPAIISQPSNAIVLVGANGVLNVQAAGDGVFTYQWQFNGANLPPVITTVAGTNTYGFSGDGGPATSAKLYGPPGVWPQGVALDAAGNLFIADSINNRVRKVDTNGIITTIAGTGTAGNGGNSGLAVNATLNHPAGVTFDSLGNLYIAEYSNGDVRKVDTNGIITRVAGTGSPGISNDGGQASTSALHYLTQVAFDGKGNMYIDESQHCRIRKVGTNGILTTLAGNAPLLTGGFSGDGGPATNAQLNTPYGMAVDAVGNVFIADFNNYRVRKVDVNGIITTIAGTGSQNFNGDNQSATSAAVIPYGLAFDPAGNLFISDSHRIRRVDINGIISTVAGKSVSGFSGDGGAATNASLNANWGIASDRRGNLFIADLGNYRVRRVNLAGDATLSLNNLGITNSGNYSVVVSSPFGSITAGVANLTVASRPTIQAFSINGQVTLSWATVSNLTYQLQYSTNLVSTNWMNLGNSITATNAAASTIDAVGTNGQRFYRVQLVP